MVLIIALFPIYWVWKTSWILVPIYLLLIAAPIYFFQGIAIVAFYFDKKNLPRPLRVFLYSLIALQQFLLLIIIGIGFFDVWLDLRKLNKPKAASP